MTTDKRDLPFFLNDPPHGLRNDGNSHKGAIRQVNNDFCPERPFEVKRFGEVVPTPSNVLKFAIVNSHWVVSEELGKGLDDLLSMDPYDLANCEDQDTKDKRVTQFPNAFNGSTVIPPKESLPTSPISRTD